jgi:hypothetical protein
MTADQLKAVLDAHALWLKGEGAGQRANLHEADLRGADLREADLSEADLRGADLSGANLSGANLRWADLHEADLRGADLSGANLSGANLRWADLSGADLSGANLSGANLSGAHLSGAQGIFDPCAWLAANCKRVRGGIEAYKTFGLYNQPPESWKQEPGAEISEVVNPNPTDDCGCGVNVATLDWVRRNNDEDLPIWKVLVKWEWMVGAVVPYGTDGKFRVPRAKLVEVVETTEVTP